jgi:hypothetical protein
VGVALGVGACLVPRRRVRRCSRGNGPRQPSVRHPQYVAMDVDGAVVPVGLLVDAACVAHEVACALVLPPQRSLGSRAVCAKDVGVETYTLTVQRQD